MSEQGEAPGLQQVDALLHRIASGRSVAFLAAQKADDGIDESVPQVGCDLYGIVMVFRDDQGQAHGRWNLQTHKEMDTNAFSALLQATAMLGQATFLAALNIAGADFRKLWELLGWNRSN